MELPERAIARKRERRIADDDEAGHQEKGSPNHQRISIDTLPLSRYTATPGLLCEKSHPSRDVRDAGPLHIVGMTHTAAAHSPHAGTWEQPMPRVRATRPVDLSGITVTEKTIAQDGRRVRISIVLPSRTRETLPVFLFLDGGVWNDKRFVRDVVVRSGAAAVFPESTPIPDAVDPGWIEEIHAAAKWVAVHGNEIGVDGSRMAVAGDSAGGNMSAVLSLMAKDRSGPKIRLQVLFYPATDTNFEAELYEDFERMGAFWRRTS